MRVTLTLFTAFLSLCLATEIRETVGVNVATEGTHSSEANQTGGGEETVYEEEEEEEEEEDDYEESDYYEEADEYEDEYEEEEPEEEEEQDENFDDYKYSHIPLHILPEFTKPREDMTYLPESENPHFLLPASIEPGQVERVFWRDGEPLDDQEAYVVGIPSQVRTEALEYFQGAGVVDFIRDILYGKEHLDLDDHRVLELKDGNKLAFRGSMWSGTNMLWIDPADEDCYETFMSILRRGGFDIVLNSLGQVFGLEGLQPDGVGLIANSYFENKPDLGQVHFDLPWARTKFYNVLIPLIIPSDGYQLYVGEDSDKYYQKVDMRHDVGLIAGAATYHGTGECDYRPKGEFRLALTVYMSDVDESNSEGIAIDSTSIWPTTGDYKFLEAQARRSWRRDGSRSLLSDVGRLPIDHQSDKLEDCHDHIDKCMTEPGTYRDLCPITCGLYIDESVYMEKIQKQVEKDVNIFEKLFNMTPEEYKEMYTEKFRYKPSEEEEDDGGDVQEEEDDFEDYEDYEEDGYDEL